MKPTPKQLMLFSPVTARKRKRGSVGRGAGVIAKPGRAGRKPQEERRGFVAHAPRPHHDRHHPVHVSIRRVRLAPSFRCQLVHAAIVEQIAAAKRAGVRVLHYSIQENHLHLMIEAESSADLARQMKRLFSRIAFAVNRASSRSGSLFRDRHHRVALTSPTQTRNALVYILFNHRKHLPAEMEGMHPSNIARCIDICSSIPWFRHWDPNERPPPSAIAKCLEFNPASSPVSEPKTWLARAGWLRVGGPLRVREAPRSSR